MARIVKTFKLDSGPWYADNATAAVLILFRDGWRITAFVDRRVRDNIRIVSLTVSDAGTETFEPHGLIEMLKQAESVVNVSGDRRVSSAVLRAIGIQDVESSVRVMDLALDRPGQPTGADQGWRLRIPGPTIDWPGFPNAINVISDRTLLAAVHYDYAVSSGDPHPSRAAGKAMGVSDSASQNLIYRARAKGILSKVEHGKAGGRLTLEGLDQLENALQQAGIETRDGDGNERQ